MSPALVTAMTSAARLFVLLGTMAILRMLVAARSGPGWIPFEVLGLAFALPLVFAGRDLRRAVSRSNSIAAFEQGLRSVTIGYCFRIAVIIAFAALYLFRIYG